jgi:hypothetical protein
MLGADDDAQCRRRDNVVERAGLIDGAGLAEVGPVDLRVCLVEALSWQTKMALADDVTAKYALAR